MCDEFVSHTAKRKELRNATVLVKENSRITYRLSWDGEPIAEYVSKFDEDFRVIVEEDMSMKWAELDNSQCANCPYSLQDKKYCPVALSIGEILFAVDDGVSTERVFCEVETPEREYKSILDYQKAISSLVGLRMATSGCSRFDFLRPMARMHLPFATLEETIVRNSAMFLLGGSFKDPGVTIGSRLDELTDMFRELIEVNQALIKRVRSALKKGDVHRNAMIVLSSFSQVLSMEEQRSNLLVKRVFKEHFPD